MSADIEYFSNTASAIEIAEHLSRCDIHFVPALSGRVEISDYARKIVSKATRFEAWSGSTLIGLIAAYCNDREQRIAYITNVSVSYEMTGEGIASCLMMQCIEYVKSSGMAQISLEVASDNMPAIKLYERSGFVTGAATAPFVTMNLYLKSGEKYEQQA